MVETSWYHLKAERCAQMAKDAVDPSRRAHLEIECRLWLQIAEAETRQDELRKKLQDAFGFREARPHAREADSCFEGFELGALHHGKRV